MSFTEEIDSFLEKYSVNRVLDAEEAKAVCAKASASLEVEVSLMSCLGEKWHVVNDVSWWSNPSKVRLYLSCKDHDSTLFVFFKGNPKPRIIKTTLAMLLEMINDDDFFHNVFAFDATLENAIFDDHSGFFCGIGYFSDAMRLHC